MMHPLARAAALALLLAATGAGAQSDGAWLERMLGGGPILDPPALDAAIAAAAAFPLGSKDNPVRAAQPQGEYAYLARLRCADGAAPGAMREGSDGIGPFDSIVDVFVVICLDSTPKETRIFMDMYHPGFVETRAVPGFAIVAPDPPAPTI